MLKIIYAVDGVAIPDMKVEKWAEEVIEKYNSSKGDTTIEIGTEVMLMQFRICVRRGLISHEDVRFCFHEEALFEVKAKSNGKLEYCPTTVIESQLMELMLDD